MKKNTLRTLIAAPLVAIGIGYNAAIAQTGDLIAMLVSQVGVSEEQASGGTAALFNVVKSQLGSDDYSTITEALPAISSVLSSNSGESSNSGLLSAATSLLGDSEGGSSLASMAQLATSFSDLGMDGSTLQAFVPVVTNYARDNGGDVVASLIQGALQ
ncbi:DUF2780 domain-containing protein [Gammaproteobacteria bacterium]|nr:DUF2780 domain-containing protein [Gammaproteobacteria bacterium]